MKRKVSIPNHKSLSHQEPLFNASPTSGVVQKVDDAFFTKTPKNAFFNYTHSTKNQTPIQTKNGSTVETPKHTAKNKTGLPDTLKNNVESLSGIDMSDVKVHYNSDKPEQINALAYTQGHDIHIGSGQEKHLPHEAWHVVQQKQGRVTPTLQMKGAAINDDVGLEKEADEMGAQSVQKKEEMPNSVSDSTIQRIKKADIPAVDLKEINDIIGNRVGFWTTEEGDELIAWAKSAAQIRSILLNYSYVEWTAVQAVFKKGDDVGTKVAQIKQNLEKEKVKLRAAAIALFKANFGKGMTLQTALADKLVALQHVETFRTKQEIDDKKSKPTGPATREWHVFINNEQASWVLHIHYHDITQAGIAASHIKPWATRKQQDSKRFGAALLLALAKTVNASDQASTDLTAHEKGLIK